MAKKSQTPPEDDIPEVTVTTRSRISTVWIIPIVAVLIGAWLTYTTVSEQGPTISITFETAEGLEAGKTKLKYKDVEVGVVETVGLTDDLSGVVVTASLIHGAEEYLTDTTRFWVVRPRFGASGVSGLGTLVSGAFIEIDPGKGGAERETFKGLETPPVIKADAPGRQYVLKTAKMGSYSNGSPVNYRGIKVGEVLGHELAKDNRTILIHIFIHAPHDKLVRLSSRFWNVSGVNVSIDADGMKIGTESLQALVVGGIAFETPTNLDAGDPAEKGHTFPLHGSREEIKEASYVEKRPIIMYFDGSVRGLALGAPVEFRGIKVGEVTDVKLEFNAKKNIFQIPVIAEIEPERFTILGERNRSAYENQLETFVQKGMRAQLKTGSFLTGQLFVDLDFHPKAAARLIGGDNLFPEIPTIPTTLDEFTNSITELITKLQKLPLVELTKSLTATAKGAEQLVTAPELLQAVRSFDTILRETSALVKNTNGLVKNVDGVVSNVNQDVRGEVKKTLNQVHEILTSIDDAVSDKSALRYDLATTLQELAAAARSIRLLTSYLERNPNALIYGKGGQGERR
ncbi:MAG: MCE family protein [Rhodospirillaceae bacterium]|jgi:paraquat-inducible protein B|nr:MCE family protein [Rhodospirillales bacterium]MBT3906873.1 MCE family protein [Rhodospirillaceae bacterium]MBT4702612.1 MCE family protein [Rhodospirillaceae bacterium]MBT5033432.1 MCE family protein [Rhodospirillaceae bacterium]MBT6221373.1 MCE family protein [Rhodospirillaceae bacterium]